jgi:hypothetical protein
MLLRHLTGKQALSAATKSVPEFRMSTPISTDAQGILFVINAFRHQPVCRSLPPFGAQ